ncbi:MAG: hypothetical protein IJD38_12385 [Clostridia bacterium]|nr:hypothetical protein [Clostridia bacterium]
MKKLIARLLVLSLLITALALPLTSCSETARLNRMDEAVRAVAFYELFEEKSDQASSVTVEQKISLKLDIGEVAYEQINESTSIYVEEGDEFTYLEQSVTTVWAGGEKTVTYQDEGYKDGMMFSRVKEDTVETRLKSPITREEYEAFRDSQVEDVPDLLVGEGYCETMTCVRGDDGTWTATYEGFTEEGMKPFWHILRGIETAVNAEHTLKDVRMTCTADADLVPQSMIMEFLFDEKEGADTRVPSIRAESYIKNLNSTTVEEPYDISNFNEIDDLRMIENFISALHDRETAQSGAFKVTTKASASYSGQDNKTTTVQNITFKNHGGVEFTVQYAQDGYDITISYKNGRMNTTVREEKTGSKVDSDSASMTDFEAQTMVCQLMNSENITALDITGGEVLDEERGRYRFVLGDSVKNELNEQYQAIYGTRIGTFRGSVMATVVEGKLMEYTYHVYNTLMIEGVTMTITVDYTVVFSDLVEDGESV